LRVDSVAEIAKKMGVKQRGNKKLWELGLMAPLTTAIDIVTAHWFLKSSVRS
jgi:hypothetical protein